MQDCTGVFAQNGAQTFRFGQILTGDNPGQYLLGITYPSMDAIQNAYDALPSNPAVQKVYSAIDVNMRSIIQIHGMAWKTNFKNSIKSHIYFGFWLLIIDYWFYIENCINYRIVLK